MILVTGSTGYLGKKIVEKIKNYELICVSRTGKSECLRHVNCDILNLTPEKITEQISTIIHAAAIINNKSPELFATNVEGTKQIIEFALAKKVEHFIFLSSSCTQLAKKNKYALSKLQGEELLIRSGLNYTIIRPNVIYGSGNKQFMSVVSIMNRFRIVPVPGDGNFQIAPVHEDDLVEAVVSCIDNKKACNKIYSICGENITYNQFLSAIASSRKINCKLLHLNKTLLSLVMNLYNREFLYSFQDRNGDCSQASQDLKFKPVTLEEGLEKSR